MSARERQTCKLMGRECCGHGDGHLSHAPAAPLPPVAMTTLCEMAVHPPRAAALPKSAPVPPAAIVQGIGLFTLFAVFLI